MNLRRDVPIVLAALAAIIGASLDGDGRWLHWIAKPLTTLLIAGIILLMDKSIKPGDVIAVTDMA